MFGFVLDCVNLARGVLGLDYIGETANLGCRGSNQLLLSLCVSLRVLSWTLQTTPDLTDRLWLPTKLWAGPCPRVHVVFQTHGF